jgi:carbonic anhydrase
MCSKCDASARRKFLSFTTAGIASVGLLGASGAISPSRSATKLSPDDALARLRAGNEKFLSAPQLCETNLAATRTEVAKGQSPWATILTCADSRVPPELVFGGVVLGELFVARNAGNTADTDTMGTIEYGAEHLGSPLIVVLGHQNCGAVAAACEVVESTPSCRAPSARWLLRSSRQSRRFGATLAILSITLSAKTSGARPAGSVPKARSSKSWCITVR